MLSEVETSQHLPLYCYVVFNLISFVVYSFCSLSLSTFWPQKVAKTPGTRVEQVTPVLCSCHIMWALGRTSFVACVCRSNIGNKRTRFTHSRHRMAHTLRHFCSYSSIGTDTRCCSNGAGLFKHYLYSRFSTSIGNPLNDGTVKNRVKARFCSGVSEEMFKVR